ncbi:MAG TPA: hypothetical protein VMU29_12135 [Smithella sp.]|nr:hypothetical protein [Smithella sp.]
MEIPEEILIASKGLELELSDFFIHKDGWIIINQKAIRKLIHRHDITIKKELCFVSNDLQYAVIKCSGEISHVYTGPFPELPKTKKRFHESLGEVSPLNNTFKEFPISVAEKRAESRVVLNLLGLYSQNWRGEYEIDEQVKAEQMIQKRQENTKKQEEITLKALKKPRKTL